MGGVGSGPKKGQPRRTKRQMAADKKREREEAEARRAANISRWNSYTGGQHAAQPAATAAAVVVVDNHDDALEVAAADDANDGPNPADGGDAAPADEQPNDAAAPPALPPPANPPGPSAYLLAPAIKLSGMAELLRRLQMMMELQTTVALATMPLGDQSAGRQRRLSLWR